MRRAHLHLRRGALVAGAVSLVLAAAGCGGSGTSDENAAGSGASPSPSASAARSASAAPSGGAQSGGAASEAAKPLTAAQLKKAALTQAQLDGYTVEAPAAGEVFAEGDIRADKKACEPVARAASGVAAPKPSTVVHRQVTGKAAEGDVSSSAAPGSDDSLESAFDVSTTFVTLASYADQRAAVSAMTSLRDAIAACGGGFTGTVRGEKQKVAKVAANTAPTGADEAVAFTVTSRQQGTGVPLKVVVLRQGATLAGMTSINMASALTGKDYDFPSEIAEAQLADLAGPA